MSLLLKNISELISIIFWGLVDPFLFLNRILFDRIITISIFASIVFFLIFLSRNIFGKRITATARYYSWYTFILSITLARSPFLPYYIFLPIYSALESYFGIIPTIWLTSLLSIFWFTITSIKLICYIKHRAYFSKSLATCSEMPDMDAFRKALIVSGINKKISVKIADYIETPASFGVMKKYILFPINYDQKYNETELYYLFLHELIHIKHGDTCKNFFLEIIHILFWFNPVIKKAIDLYKQDCEIRCDLATLKNQLIKNNVYGMLLMKELYVNNNIPFATGFNNNLMFLKDRLIEIHNFSPTAKKQKALCIAIFIFIATVVSVHTSYAHDQKTGKVMLIVDTYENNGTRNIYDVDISNLQIISNDKIFINTDYIASILSGLDKSSFQNVEIIVLDSSNGLFSSSCWVKNHYPIDTDNLAFVNDSLVLLSDNSFTQKMFSFCLKIL